MSNNIILRILVICSFCSLSAQTYFTSLSSTRGRWQDAQSYCQSQGSTLASIHSLEDWNKAKVQCGVVLSANSYDADGCWIGLNNNEVQSEYVWSDATTSDYGFTNNDPSQPIEGEDPWAYTERPYSAGPYVCALMRVNEYFNYEWMLYFCNTWNIGYPVCNGNPPPSLDPTSAPTTSTPTHNPASVAPTASSYNPTVNPTAEPTQAPTKKTCTNGVDYAIDGTICQVLGDPHFTTFNGWRHDFMGQPGTGKSQYYYVKPCAGELTDDLPFTIIGNHKELSFSTATFVEYLTFELFDDDATQYLLFLSPYVAGYRLRDPTVSTLYNDNVATLNAIPSGTDTAIGNRFNIKYTKITTIFSSKIAAVLTVDGTCTVEFWMRGAEFLGNRVVHLYLSPPECYKCFICGLCGDFKRQMAASGPQRLETCNGGYVVNSGDFDYDVNGNTWEVSYCTRRRRRRLQEYIPDVGDTFEEIEACDSSIESQVVNSCQTARDNATACCDYIGATFCDALQETCEFDACIMSGANATAIEANVEQLFTAAVHLACDIPGVAGLMDEARITVNTPQPTTNPVATPTTEAIEESVTTDTPSAESDASAPSMLFGAISIYTIVFRFMFYEL